ncbi:hypothetical protein BRD17_06650, partial [Halobacteriales archaeon SW_7_68_16]
MEYGSVVLWLVTALAFGAAGAQIVAVLLPSIPDESAAALGFPTVVAVFGFVGFWVGQFAWPWPALVVALLVLLGGAVAVRLAGSGAADLDADGVGRRSIAGVAGLFALAFGLLVVVRAFDPAIQPIAGEKFLDFGLLKSLLRADSLPAEDPWFAGRAVQYYYGGHAIAALFATLTGTTPAVAYNLALAVFYATFVVAAYGLAAALADARDIPARPAGLVAAFFVGIASNLSTPARVLAWLVPGGEVVAGTLGLGLDWAGESLAAFSYWPASRVIEGGINEFPLFAFVNGDLHAHMMSPPILLLAAALLGGYWRAPRNAIGRRLGLLGIVGALGGLIAVVNTWSLPSILGLTALTVVTAPESPVTLIGRTPADDPVRAEIERLLGGVAVTVGVGLAALVAVAPFFLSTASTRGVGVLPARSTLGPLLVVHGVFLAVAVLYLRRHAPHIDRRGHFVVALALFVLVALEFGAPAVALLGPVLAAALIGTRRGWLGHEGVLLAGAAGLILTVEFVYVVEEAGPGRFNTVFKTYAQVWAMFAVVAGVAVVDVTGLTGSALLRSLRRLPTRIGAVGRTTRTDGGRPRLTVPSPGPLIVIVLVVGLSIYGGLTVANHVGGGGDPTLDGVDYVDRFHPEEAAAIEWLDDRPGQPTIVTAPTDGGRPYRWDGALGPSPPGSFSGGSAPSSLTGVPTVAGWSHEIGYRGRAAYERRVADVDAIYTGDVSTRARLLATYDVDYVYVGPAERARYDRPAFFGFEVAHESGGVTIYAVPDG